MQHPFDWFLLSPEDLDIALSVLGSMRPADLVIAPDGEPYLYRWHIIKTPQASVYFHIQVADDPERPLHDHPWDNQSVILAGGYDETMLFANRKTHIFHRSVGDTIFRLADWAHRLLLPQGFPYTMSLFSTGPKRRQWGFWYPEGWVDADEVCRLDGNVSVHMKRDSK